jgi:hypothetical protein
MAFNYNNLTLSELINKIDTSRFFNLPKMVAEALKKLQSLISANEPKYKVYTALLTQSGTDAPIATVLENTLGFTPTLIRENIGKYSLQSSNMWTGNEAVFLGGGESVSNIAKTFYNTEDSDIENILIQVLDVNGEYVDNILNKTSIEIRVYN